MARGVLGAQGADDIGLAGDDGQLLGAVVADEPKVFAQGLLVFGGQIDDPLHPRQMLWQGSAHGLGLGGRPALKVAPAILPDLRRQVRG